MSYGYGYGGYPAPGGYYPPPPVPDQLAQLRQQQFQQPIMGQNMGMMQGNQMQNNMGMQGMNQPAMQQAQMPSDNSNIIWVSGYKEAEDYLVANNAAVEMRDTNNQFLYVKQRDASGKPTIECYALTKVDIAQTAPQPVQAAQAKPVQYVTVEQFNALAERYDAIAEELEALKAKRTTRKPTKEESDNE